MSTIKDKDKFILFVVLLVVFGALYFVSLGFMEETKQKAKENEITNEKIMNKIKEKFKDINEDKDKEEIKIKEEIKKDGSKVFEVIAEVEFTEKTEYLKAEKDFDKLVRLVKTSPTVKNMKILKIKVK